MQGVPVEPLARYFECWLLKLQGVYPPDVRADCADSTSAATTARSCAEGHGFLCRGCHGPGAPTTGSLSARALAFVRAARRVRPVDAACARRPAAVLRELEQVHRTFIRSLLDRSRGRCG